MTEAPSKIAVVPELDFQPKEVSAPSSFKYNKVFPEESQSITLQAAGTTRATFILPDVGMNLSKSVLSFILQIPESATASHVNWIHQGGYCYIENISLKTTSGNVIGELRGVGNYTRMVLPYSTSVEKLLTKEKAFGRATAAACKDSGIGDGFNRTDILSGTAMAAASPNGQELQCIDANAAILKNCDINYTDVSELLVGVARDGAAAGDVFQQIRLPLGELIDTIFAVNKTLVWNQQVIIEIDFQQGNKMGFTCASATALTSPATIATTPALTYCQLYLAVEQNDAIVADLRRMFASGFSMPVPYVHMKKTQTGTSGVTSVTFRLNRAHGQKLRRVYNGWFHATETGTTAFCRGNETAGVVSGVRSLIMNVPRQDYTMGVANGECYLANRDLIKGSVAAQSHANFEHHFTWIDDFSGVKTVDIKDKQTWDQGLDIILDSDYTVESTMGAVAKFLYQYAVCQRTLMFKDNVVLVQ